MNGVIHSVRRTWRMLARKPLFSLTLVGMLGVGIAGNVAVFSIFNCLFLRPLPFADSQRLIDIDETAPQWNLVHVGIANPDLYQWRTQNSTFESMSFCRRSSCNLTVGKTTVRIVSAQVTHEMLDVLRLRPLMGRNFTEAEDRPGGPPVALLSYGLWQRMFSSNRTVVGEAVKIDDQPYTVIGVLPPEAVFPDRTDLWVPLAPDPNANSGYYANGIGRLQPGVSIHQAQADLLRIHKAMIAQGRTINEITSPLLMPLRDRYLGDFKMVSRVLLGAVAIVLLIACVNIASLMMVHSTGRTREFAIRSALGASLGRIAAQVFAESSVLALIGGLVGIVTGMAAVHAMVPLLSEKLPQWVSLSLDWRFALFSLLITCAATVLFGLLPALQSSGVGVRGSLQDVGTRTTPPRRQRATLKAFVVCEISLALMLSISAGLLLQAFRNVMWVDPGFQPENVLTFRVRIPDSAYPKQDQKISYYDRLLERLAALPGVNAAGVSSAPPLGGQWGGVFEAEGGRAFSALGDNPTVLQVAVTPGYFRAIGMTLLDGRAFEAQDSAPMPRLVAMVNETFASHFWSGGSPVGKRVRRLGAKDWLEVVGVVRDEKHYGLDQPVLPGVFLPYSTALATSLRGDERGLQEMSVVLRTSTNPKSLIAPAHEIVNRINPEIPMYATSTMEETLDQSLWTRRAYSSLFGGFAILAVVLAAAGIYGTVSYGVSQRTQEIGIRMALGARPGHVFGQVLRGVMALVSGGAVAGLMGAFWAASLIRSLLFGARSHDPLIYAVVVLGITGVAFLAALVPARRAAKVDPMVALRYE